MGSERLTWHDLWVIARQSPPASAVGRAVLGEAAMWSTSDYLLAAVVDILNVANWLNSRPGSKRPTPIERPGDTDTARISEPDSMTFEEVEVWLGWSVNTPPPAIEGRHDELQGSA